MPSKRLYIVGIGPGSKDFITPLARKRIRDSSCLIGARRVLSLFNNIKKERIYLEGNYDKVIDYIKKSRKKITVLVSGDPGLYSFLGKIKKHLEKEYYEVIPGISTMQLAFARIGETWEDAKIISLHGSDLNNLAGEVKDSGKVFLLTDPGFPPDKVAEYLLKNGIQNRRAFVFSELTYPNERIIDTNLEDLSRVNPVRSSGRTCPAKNIIYNKKCPRPTSNGVNGFGLCVMIIVENSTE